MARQGWRGYNKNMNQKLGKYELIAELGQGGFATVYRARDTQIGREVALKVIGGPQTGDPGFVKRFRREARVAADLHHPNIVTVYDFDQASGVLYLAMRLINGRPLGQHLNDHQRLSLTQALPILAQLADALDHLQSRQLVHRDLTPANVMLEGDGDDIRVTLTDFGLIRSLETSLDLTETRGGILGTPAYLAPEQADPKRWGDMTPLTDVYALGVMAFEMLTGQKPFAGDLTAVLYAHAMTPPPPAPDVDEAVAAVLQKGMAKEQDGRFASAGEFVKALQDVAVGLEREQVTQSTLEGLLVEARAARDAEQWLKVQSLTVQIMQIDRAHPHALAMMSEATEGLQRESAEEVVRRQRAARYDEGMAAMEAGQWTAALTAFEEVVAAEPDFQDAQACLTQARDECLWAQWFEAAVAYGNKGKWFEACQAWLWILEGRPDYRRGKAGLRFQEATRALLALHEQQQTSLRRARDTLLHYDKLTHLTSAVEQRDWQAILDRGRVILQLAPDLEWVEQWVNRATMELAKDS